MPKQAAEKQYTLVQHSAAGFKGDPAFARGLEPRAVTPAQARAVERAGGVVFDDYAAADKAGDTFMYPPQVEGIAPGARGTFADYTVDGLKVYIPVREVRIVG